MSASSAARRLTAVALVTGSVVAAAALPASAVQDRAPDRRQVVISDVQYNAPGPDTRSNRSLNGEWVNITNRSRHSVDLRGWTLRNSKGDKYTFRHLRLNGRSTVTVHTGSGRDTRHDVYQDRRHHIWDNHSDRATLSDRRGSVVDTESWGRGHGHDRDRDRDRGHDRDRGDNRDRGHNRGNDRDRGHDRSNNRADERGNDNGRHQR
ncbi:lamin tail domain-containing protein [Streptomyces sp. NPDC001812]|uniref:lamin tail domain-containing protein n=1 Tax=Streptomyces sp. NPDC001812 TaxID=3364611 RepID=UPI0036C359D6